MDVDVTVKCFDTTARRNSLSRVRCL